MTTGGTVRDMRTLPAEKLEEMRAEVGLRAAMYREAESRSARERRNEAMARWHDELGEGSLSAIGRAAGLSRIQAGRIVAAQRDKVPGQPAPPTRRYYQSKGKQQPEPIIE